MSSPTVLVALACVLALACTPSAPPPSPSPAPPPDPSPTFLAVTAPASEDPGLTATVVDAAWGSTGVVSTAAPIPYWVLSLVDLETTRDATGVSLVSLELFDAEARLLGAVDREIVLGVSAPDATLYTSPDLPFEGTITAGHPLRLRIHARMEDAFAERVTTPPASHRITLRTEAGAIIRIAGPVGGPWPTG